MIVKEHPPYTTSPAEDQEYVSGDGEDSFAKEARISRHFKLDRPIIIRVSLAATSERLQHNYRLVL
jgi:hypothetical protein